MASITPRERWMVSQVVTAFQLAPYESAIQTLFRNRFASKIDPFLKGLSSSQHLLFFYEGGNEPSTHPGPIIDKLSCSEGISMDPDCGFVYFIRTIAFRKPVNLNIAGDADLVFGQFPQLPLQSLHSTLRSFFLPAVEYFDNSDWKKCSHNQRNDLIRFTSNFCKELGEAIDSFTDGIQLRKPDPRFSLIEIRMDYLRACRNPDIVSHFEELLDEWCRQIEKYLEASSDAGATQTDGGPRSEARTLHGIESWRTKMRRLSSIIHQLKSDTCHTVFQVLQAVTKLSPSVSPKSRQAVFHTLRRCKQLDIAITEAFNEARDNVKYLTTLERFIDPLYSGAPSNVFESLNALMNAIAMIYSISRYYNTSERMAAFFTKITKQARPCFGGTSSPHVPVG
ncbi:hypothetical protein cyc_02562 [Cyclospora cayetanensis]|uniref:Dynein heavy chain tail domain-containing protein n=1 Tax=Cyclospora cayetanensis TaxID=88456 RepID=A0A1D3CYU0_9EIME|nr:hypothetical protein cyc_02562 [Cyclospora cayetanensis]